jgi:SHOCT-like domain
MDDERRRILKMIEEGRLSAEEGASLLDALDAPDQSGAKGAVHGESKQEAKSLHIRVIDGASGRDKVNLNVPIALTKMVSSLLPDNQRERLREHGISVDDLIRAVESGEVGKVIEIKDDNTDDQVEITIE